MIIGTVSRHQVPLMMTFSESDADYICDIIGASIEEAANYVDFFQFDFQTDPFEE